MPRRTERLARADVFTRGYILLLKHRVKQARHQRLACDRLLRVIENDVLDGVVGSFYHMRMQTEFFLNINHFILHGIWSTYDVKSETQASMR